MPIETNTFSQQASIFSDLNSLDAIRRQGLNDKSGAIKKAAQEFEAFFLKMMLKSMRQASEAMGENELFGSQQEKMFTGMMDEQLAVDLSTKGSLGIAELMVAQLNGSTQVNNDNQPQILPERRAYANSIKTLQTNDSGTDVLFEHINKSLSKGLANSNNSGENYSKNNYSKSKDEMPVEVNAISQHPTLEDNLLKPSKKSLFEDAKAFVETLKPYAEKAANLLKLDPKVLIAQAALETGWGKHIMHDEAGNPGFNLFGIKSNNQWKGESIKIDTLEVESNQFKKVNASFRKYQNFEQSFEDYAKFLISNSRYEEAVNATSAPEEFVKNLQSSGYATDPQYANKIMRIFNDEIIQSIESVEHH